MRELLFKMNDLYFQELASSMGVPFIETSALSGSNVAQMFAKVAQDIRNISAPDNIVS